MLNFQGHKSKDMLSLPLGIPDVAVLQVGQNEHGDYIITVESTLKGTVCQHCGRQITKLHGHGRWIELRHLPILGHRVIRALATETVYVSGLRKSHHYAKPVLVRPQESPYHRL